MAEGLDYALLSAMIAVESGGDTFACRFEAGYPFLFKPKEMAKLVNTTINTEINLQRCSWGLMQIMGATARECGLRTPIPTLTDPEIGLLYGCRYLRKQLRRYNNNVTDAIAAYNAGSVVLRPSADGTSYHYSNQAHVIKVMAAMQGGLHVAV